MSVLVPCPNTVKRNRASRAAARGGSAKSWGQEIKTPSPEQFAHVRPLGLVKSDVYQTLALIQADLAELKPLKEQLQRTIETALEQSSAESLRDCRLELVGSSSWHGDVPQSDVDLVLFTPGGCSSGRQSVEALKDLRQSLEDMSCSTLQQIELIETARVPILRMHSSQGLHCDISVDQHHSVAHRDLLKHLLATCPEAQDLVRLVKFWVRCRGLPTAAEGGLPSLAWAIIAIRFAQSRPKGSHIEVMFCDFFEEMQHLSDHSLSLRASPVEGALGMNALATHFEWRPRGDSSTAWADEWLDLVAVEDPCSGHIDWLPASSQSMHLCNITPPSMPAALGLIYIVDLRLAQNAVREGRWHDVWRRPAHAAPAMDGLVDSQLHVVIKDGQISVGKMQDVKYCKELYGDILNHRDQSSQLSLQVCKVRQGSARNVYAKARKSMKLTCQPCHWVCALSMAPRMLFLEDGLMRLAEIIQVVGITRVSPDMCATVLSWKNACADIHPVENHSNVQSAFAHSCATYPLVPPIPPPRASAPVLVASSVMKPPPSQGVPVRLAHCIDSKSFGDFSNAGRSAGRVANTGRSSRCLANTEKDMHRPPKFVLQSLWKKLEMTAGPIAAKSSEARCDDSNSEPKTKMYSAQEVGDDSTHATASECSAHGAEDDTTHATAVEAPTEAGDDSTRASASDSESQSTSGVGSDLGDSACLQSYPPLPGSRGRITFLGPVSSAWKPTLRHESKEFNSKKSQAVTAAATVPKLRKRS